MIMAGAGDDENDDNRRRAGGIEIGVALWLLVNQINVKRDGMAGGRGIRQAGWPTAPRPFVSSRRDGVTISIDNKS